MRMTITRCVVLVAIAACQRPHTEPRVLRVCADPNNLPFSNRSEEGFENRIANLLARELDAQLAYEWRAQRRGFLRNGLNAGVCDVVIGLASTVDHAWTTRPYYRSSYVFVQPRDAPGIASFDDPALRTRRIGVQIVGDDYANTPPVHALARRGLAHNLVGFTLYGDYGQDSPPADVVRAVARGEVDLAIAWGPLGGYFGQRSDPPLDVHPVTASAADPDLPMQFDISLAVRRGHKDLHGKLEQILERRRESIDAILDAYGVPRA